MRPLPFPPLRLLVRDAGGFCALAAGALAAGMLLDRTRATPLGWAYESRDARLGHAVERLRAPRAGKPLAAPREVGLEEFQRIALGREAMVLDARAGTFYRLGHVPGALNLAREEFERDYAALRAPLAANGRKPLAVYCSDPSCPDARLVAEALEKLGQENILIYPEGWEQWQQTGLPQETAAKKQP